MEKPGFQNNNEYAGRADNRPVIGSSEMGDEAILESDETRLKEAEEKSKTPSEQMTDAKVSRFPYESVPGEWFFDMDLINELPDETDQVNQMDLKATVAVLKQRFGNGMVKLSKAEFDALDEDEKRLIMNLNSATKLRQQKTEKQTEEKPPASEPKIAA